MSQWKPGARVCFNIGQPQLERLKLSTHSVLRRLSRTNAPSYDKRSASCQAVPVPRSNVRHGYLSLSRVFVLALSIDHPQRLRSSCHTPASSTPPTTSSSPLSPLPSHNNLSLSRHSSHLSSDSRHNAFKRSLNNRLLVTGHHDILPLS